MQEKYNTKEREKVKEEFYLTILIVGLLVVTAVLLSVMTSGTVTTFWVDILVVPLVICLNFLAAIVALAIKEWSQQRKAKRKQIKSLNVKIIKYRKNKILPSIFYGPVDNQSFEFRYKICPVCTETIGDHQDLAKCSVCGSIYHMDHLEEWLDGTSKCVVCKYEIKKANLR
ncbi:MAG: hypothetical protein ACTSO7_07205 [Candidatus Heimdallarchaeota archaeon]